MTLFSTISRTPHSNDWKLDRLYKSSGMVLSNSDSECKSDRTGHQFVFGTKMFSSGKHAWRTTISSTSNHWIFIGIGQRKKSFYRDTLSFAHDNSWGFSSLNQTYTGGAKTIKSRNINYKTATIDWYNGHVIDCLLDLDNGTMSYRNNNTTSEFKLQGIPRRNYWPHYNLYYAGSSFKVTAIHPSDYGKNSLTNTTTSTTTSTTTISNTSSTIPSHNFDDFPWE